MDTPYDSAPRPLIPFLHGRTGRRPVISNFRRLKTQPDLGKSIHADADKTAIITIKAAEVPVDSR